MGGAVRPLPQYAFMTWCSVRGSTGAYGFVPRYKIQNDLGATLSSTAGTASSLPEGKDVWNVKRFTSHVCLEGRNSYLRGKIEWQGVGWVHLA
jgi:hypothetical protein